MERGRGIRRGLNSHLVDVADVELDLEVLLDELAARAGALEHGIVACGDGGAVVVRKNWIGRVV